MHDPSLTDERELLDAVTAAVSIALDNGRLHAELKARLEELEGSRSRVLKAGQGERKRLERNLHDGAQQRLIALSLELKLLGTELGDDAPAQARVESARDEIAVSLEELRSVARGLHPAVLRAHGLRVALESLVATSPVPVGLTVKVEDRLEEPIEVAAYYVVSESLTNVAKHAEAGQATVEVALVDGSLVVEVFDDGFGGADTENGSGLRGLADRVEALGGRLRIWSPAGAAPACERRSMRVAIAEDSVLLREGIVRILAEAGFEVVAQCDDADDSCSRSAATARPRHRRHPLATDPCRRGHAGGDRDPGHQPSVGVLVLSQYVELGLAMELLAESAEGAGYLLKDRSRRGRVRRLPSGAWPPGAPPSTRSSFPRCSTAAAGRPARRADGA